MPFAEAFRHSVEQNKQGSLLILELVQKMVQRKISIRSIEGPIGIGRAAGQAASKKGWTPLLELTAGISLNLGIFNLLPIPIMDGGVILLLFVESLMRRDISLRIKERIYQAAFVFLVLFAVMVIYNDVAEDAAQHYAEDALKAAVSYQPSAVQLRSSWPLLPTKTSRDRAMRRDLRSPACSVSPCGEAPKAHTHANSLNQRRLSADG